MPCVCTNVGPGAECYKMPGRRNQSSICQAGSTQNRPVNIQQADVALSREPWAGDRALVIIKIVGEAMSVVQITKLMKREEN